MTQSFSPGGIRTETNLLAAARIKIQDGEVVKNGAGHHNYFHLQVPTLPKDDDGNPMPPEMEPALYDFYVRYGGIGKNNSLYIRGTK